MKEYTEDEVREQFLNHILHLVDYWENETGAPDSASKLDGLAFSLLVLLDGGTDLPQFIVASLPHPSDKSFHQEEGGNWYPENHASDVKGDIGGGLHEMYSYLRKIRDEQKERTDKIDTVLDEE